jgi:hypothetical protein
VLRVETFTSNPGPTTCKEDELEREFGAAIPDGELLRSLFKGSGGGSACERDGPGSRFGGDDEAEVEDKACASS